MTLILNYSQAVWPVYPGPQSADEEARFSPLTMGTGACIVAEVPDAMSI